MPAAFDNFHIENLYNNGSGRVLEGKIWWVRLGWIYYVGRVNSIAASIDKQWMLLRITIQF